MQNPPRFERFSQQTCALEQKPEGSGEGGQGQGGTRGGGCPRFYHSNIHGLVTGRKRHTMRDRKWTTSEGRGNLA